MNGVGLRFEKFLVDGGEIPLSIGLPERYVLPPDGHCVEVHIDSLYPSNVATRELLAFASPLQSFHDLLRPQSFRQALAGLRLAVAASDQPALIAASELLQSHDEDEHLLQMALHLLHKV